MGAITRSILGADPLQPAQELYQSANQVTEDIVTNVGKAAVGALDVVNQGNIAINKAVTPANALGPLDVRNYGVDLPDSVDKVLDTSYHDVRKRVVDYARSEHGEGWGIAADILTPDAIDFVGGIGYWDNIAKGIGKVRKFAPEVSSAARRLTTTLDDMLSPQLQAVGAAGGVFEPSTVRRIIGTDDALAATALKHATDVKRVPLASRAGASIADRLYPGKQKMQRLRRESILADNPIAEEYRQLLTKYEKINKDIPLTTVGNKQVKITPIKKDIFEKDVRRLVELKKELKLPNAQQFNKELGAFMDESGELYRLGSKGDFKPEGYANVQKRLANQGLIPVTEQFDPLKPKWGAFTNSIRQKITTKLGLKKPEKDHIVRLENQIAILGKKLDVKKSGFVDRDPKFMDELAGELHRRGHNLGDQNLNFLQMSEEAHRTGRYSRHVISQSLTDAELPHTYLEADEIFTTLKDGTKKWLKVDVIDINKGTFRLKDGDKIIPNKNIASKGNYKFAGREYEKGQRQGLSLTTRKVLGRIDNPKELADAYEMFATDAGAHEIMSGIQTAASYIYDNPKELDALSKQIRNENIPNMIKFLKYALTTKEFKGDPVYTKLLNRFTDKLKQNMTDYVSDLRIRGSW